MKRWNIPEWLETHVLERDKDCIYCRATFEPLSPKARPTWEHIINDSQMVTRENIALCCISCNSSKGNRPLPSKISTRAVFQSPGPLSSTTVLALNGTVILSPTRGPYRVGSPSGSFAGS
jgi:5-methylcytosine-specific restriction endonuclease McrA